MAFPLIRALHNYDVCGSSALSLQQGRSARELSFKRGDIIAVLDFVDDNWLSGELRGVRGLVPVTYIDPTPLPAGVLL